MVASMAEQPHVLVVDDDAKIAAALRRALIYEGYQVEVAPDCQPARTAGPTDPALCRCRDGPGHTRGPARRGADPDDGEGIRLAPALHAQSRAGAPSRAAARRRLGL